MLKNYPHPPSVCPSLSLKGISIGAIAALTLGGPFIAAGSAGANLKPRQITRMELAQATVDNQPRFSCQFYNGQYTVMYYPKSRPTEPFAWATPGALGGGWTPERRCAEIARRFEEYRPDGLVELQNSQLNGYNIVCVTTRQNPSCRLVFTIPPGQDPIATRNRVFDNVVVADRGDQTQPVTTFSGADGEQDLLGDLVKLGRSALGMRDPAPQQRGPINLLPFLDPADGGTGAGLK